MKIVEYDDVDPLSVLYLNLLSLGYPLTLEKVSLIRHLDARPFPFFAVYAIEDGIVAGQVGIYRLPMITTNGPEDVGGICAMCIHPAFSRQGIATQLLDEAHTRMRSDGLRFSTLGTARHRAAHALYKKQGYEDVFISTSTFTTRENVHSDSHLLAECATSGKLHLADSLFQKVAVGNLGFARRDKSFFSMMVATGEIAEGEIRLLWDGNELVGYALAGVSESVLSVSSLLLAEGVDAGAAISALAQDKTISHIRVRVDHQSIATSLQRTGYSRVVPDWGTFMIKSLTPEVSSDDACHLFGIGTERFMISRIDVT